MKFQRQDNCVYKCKYHLVLVSRYRRKIFNEGARKLFEEVLKVIEVRYPGIKVEEINTDKDHTHLLVSIAPKYSVGKVVGIIKSNSGRVMKERLEFLKEVYWGRAGIWSGGYFVSTVGLNEEVIRRYIEQQGQEDSGQAELEF